MAGRYHKFDLVCCGGGLNPREVGLTQIVHHVRRARSCHNPNPLNPSMLHLLQNTRRTSALLSIFIGLFLAGCTTPSGTGKRDPDFTH